MPPFIAAACVSGSASTAPIKVAALTRPTNAKIASQPSAVSRNPPIIGASIGATTVAVVTQPIIAAAWSRS